MPSTQGELDGLVDASILATAQNLERDPRTDGDTPFVTERVGEENEISAKLHLMVAHNAGQQHISQNFQRSAEDG